MKITKENIKDIPISNEDKGLLSVLLQDLEEINHNLPLRMPYLFINRIDEHTEYSPERTDPCPDYYGMYQIMRGNEILGVEMNLEDLDASLCLLYNFLIEE